MSVQMRQVNIAVAPVVYDRLTELAKARNMATGPYAKLLFDAAYSARCGVTGDGDLDAAVSRVVLLFGTKEFDTAEIARAIGMSEAFVDRTLIAWRDEMRGASKARASS